MYITIFKINMYTCNGWNSKQVNYASKETHILLATIQQLVRTLLQITFKYMSLKFPGVAEKSWLAMSEITKSSSKAGSLWFFKFKWLPELCTTHYPQTHTFLHIKKFSRPPSCEPILAVLQQKDDQVEGCGCLDLTPSFTSGFLETIYNL